MQIVWILNKEMDISTSQASRLEMSEALMALGHEVVLVARYRTQRKALGEKIPILYLPTVNLTALRYFTFLISLWFWLPVYLFRSRPNVVLVDRPSLVWALLPWLSLSHLSRLKIAWVLDVRSPPVDGRGLVSLLGRWAYRSGLWLAGRLMDGWSTITSSMRADVAHYGHIPADHIVVWSSGVFTDAFSPAAHQLPADWPFESKFVYIYIGILTNERPLTEMIEAFALICNEIPDARLLFLGSGPDLELLRDFARHLGVQDRVCFHEPVSHKLVPDYLAASDVGLLLAPDTHWYRSSSPLKLVEYLSMGKPVIATDIESVRLILQGRGDAILISCGENRRPHPVALAQGMRDAWQRFGRGYESVVNRQIAVQEFDWNTRARCLEKYLLDVCGFEGGRSA